MSEYDDAIVFIDRSEAKVFHFNAIDEVKLVFTHGQAQRKHHEASHEDGTKHAVDDEFMQRSRCVRPSKARTTIGRIRMAARAAGLLPREAKQLHKHSFLKAPCVGSNSSID